MTHTVVRTERVGRFRFAPARMGSLRLTCALLMKLCFLSADYGLCLVVASSRYQTGSVLVYSPVFLIIQVYKLRIYVNIDGRSLVP